MTSESRPAADLGAGACLLNPHLQRTPVRDGAEDPAPTEVRRFHASLPDYAETPLVSLPTLAAEVGVRALLVKDESNRLGLPAFKMLGASWAAYRAIAARAAGPVQPSLDALRAAVGDLDGLRLVTATDGNHGRAVARMARLLGLAAYVVVPAEVPERAIELIRGEGATVEVIDAPYDDAVHHAAEQAAADPAHAVLVQDTSWAGYQEVPQWIVDGYATLFEEAAAQATVLGERVDLMLVPAGVGSLAQAAVLFARGRPGFEVVVVEPEVADCLFQSMLAGESVSVETGATSMAGLNCGTPSLLAWPEIRSDAVAAVRIRDADTARAMRDLAMYGVDAGACGAAPLAALRQLVADPALAETLGLGSDASVLLIDTEGVATPA